MTTALLPNISKRSGVYNRVLANIKKMHKALEDHPEKLFNANEPLPELPEIDALRRAMGKLWPRMIGYMYSDRERLLNSEGVNANHALNLIAKSIRLRRGMDEETYQAISSGKEPFYSCQRVGSLRKAEYYLDQDPKNRDGYVLREFIFKSRKKARRTKVLFLNDW